MAVESFPASSLRTKIMGGQGFPGPGSAAALNRLAQPLHCKFDILGLQLAPALDFSLVPLFREALEISPSAERCRLSSFHHGCFQRRKSADRPS